ncbi:MAG: hypothetical protein IKN53_03735, partial [Oscillibacter sp.]|nr:hypothetical protein [Oscillibacter sp.]
TYPTLCVSGNYQKRSDLILGKVYTIQTTFTTSGGDEEHVLDVVNDTISASITSRIVLNDGAIYRDYVGNLYHAFLVHLTRSDEDGSRTAVAGEPTVSGTYQINGGATQNYMNASATTWTASGGYVQFTVAESLRSSLTNPANGYATTISANVYLDYNSNKIAIEDQFPPRPADLLTDTVTGTTLFVKSNIDSSMDRVAYSHTSERTADSTLNRYFCGWTVKKAVLSYHALSTNVTGNLGINPLDQDIESSVTIDTRGVLNFYEVERQSEGYTHLRISLTLGQKSDGYVANLNLADYFDALTIAGVSIPLNTTSATLRVPKTSGGIEFDEGGCEVTIPVEYTVKTGAALEAGGTRTYSNYKVTLDVDLVQVANETEKLLVNAKPDYIIYTNARVIPDFIG